MTAFHSRQLDCGRRIRQKADTNAFQISITSSTAKLHGSFRETRIIVCNNFSSCCNHKVQCYRFNEVQALPLVWTRFLRLANSSPKTARSPARRSCDGHEPSGKKFGEMPRVMSAQLPGNSRATTTAMPPDGRADDSQDNSQYRAQRPRNIRVAVRATEDATTREPFRKTTRQNYFLTLSTMTPPKL